jgi:hypothetical protein
MNKKILFIALSIILVGLIGLFIFNKFSDDRISGKILIVQKNAISINLALVNVYAVSKQDADRWKTRVLKECYNVCEEIIQRRHQRLAEIDKTRKENDLLVKHYELNKLLLNEAKVLSKKLWLSDANNNENGDKFLKLASSKDLESYEKLTLMAHAHRWKDAYDFINTELSRMDTQLSENDTLFKNKLEIVDSECLKDVVRLRLELIKKTSPAYLSVFPSDLEIVSSDLTDESGCFNLHVPKGEYYVFANSSRTVLSDENPEKYYWAYYVRVPSQQAKKCLLGNMNLVEHTVDSLWRDLPSLVMKSYRGKLEDSDFPTEFKNEE